MCCDVDVRSIRASTSVVTATLWLYQEHVLVVSPTAGKSLQNFLQRGGTERPDSLGRFSRISANMDNVELESRLWPENWSNGNLVPQTWNFRSTGTKRGCRREGIPRFPPPCTSTPMNTKIMFSGATWQHKLPMHYPCTMSRRLEQQDLCKP